LTIFDRQTFFYALTVQEQKGYPVVIIPFERLAPGHISKKSRILSASLGKYPKYLLFLVHELV
jgi:hypothetical protein